MLHDRINELFLNTLFMYVCLCHVHVNVRITHPSICVIDLFVLLSVYKRGSCIHCFSLGTHT